MTKSWFLLIVLAWFFSVTSPYPTALAEEGGQFVGRPDGREMLKSLRKKREQQREHQQQHQASIRKLESIGYDLEYDLAEDGSASVPIYKLDAIYIANSLSERISIPVIRISPYRNIAWKHDELTVAMLLPFTNLRMVNLMCCELTHEDIVQLQDFPDLEHVILPDEFLERETAEKIQAMLPHCKLESRNKDDFKYHGPILKY